jgi:hypothetical protein
MRFDRERKAENMVDGVTSVSALVIEKEPHL